MGRPESRQAWGGCAATCKTHQHALPLQAAPFPLLLAFNTPTQALALPMHLEQERVVVWVEAPQAAIRQHHLEAQQLPLAGHGAVVQAGAVRVGRDGPCDSLPRRCRLGEISGALAGTV